MIGANTKLGTNKVMAMGLTNFSETKRHGCMDEEVFFQPKRITVVSKTTKLDYITKRHSNLNHQQLVELILKSGLIYDDLKMKRTKHEKCVRDICSALSTRSVETKVVNGDEYSSEDVKWCEAIFSVGGDGTFLMASAKVFGRKPVIGFNSDPDGSEGHLCVTKKSKNPMKIVIDDLFEGKFRWITRQRIRVSLLITTGDQNLAHFSSDSCEMNSNEGNEVFPSYEPTFPLLALNDVFIGERQAARASCFDLQINDGPKMKQKSSGLTVSTGTGSTAWYYTINHISKQQIEQILSIIQSMNLLNSEMNDHLIDEICQRHNDNLVFDPNFPGMAYAIREPVCNKTYQSVAPCGFAQRIFVRSRCSDAQLVLDGSLSMSFNEGSEVLLEVYKDDALLSVCQDVTPGSS